MGAKINNLSYSDLCKGLLDSGAEICSFNSFEYAPSDNFLYDIQNIDPLKKYIVFRHDVDHDPLAALKMGVIENKLGITSTFFILKSNDNPPINNWWVQRPYDFVKILKELQSMNHEIGLHYDFMGDYFSGNTKAASKLRDILGFLRENGLKIEGCASHGSSRMRRMFNITVNNPYPHPYMNYNIWKETYHFLNAKISGNSKSSVIKKKLELNNKTVLMPQLSLEALNLRYEAYYTTRKFYLSDSGGKFWRFNNSPLFTNNAEESPTSETSIFDLLTNNLKLGDVAQLLAHPWWWKDRV